MTMTAASRTQDAPPARWQIEWELCDIASDVTGIARDKISPASRMIQDLHLDSLALVDFIFRVEDRFVITIPDRDEQGAVCKQVFTRDPLLLRDFAEVVLAQWGTGKRAKTLRRDSSRATTPAANGMPFLQLDGSISEQSWLEGPLYEPLAPLGDGLAQYRRRTDGMRCVLVPGADVRLGGGPPEAEPDELPMRTIRLSAFVIDVEPVSVTAYTRFLNSVGPIPDSIAREWFWPADDDRRAVHLPLRRGFRRWREVEGTERRPMMMVSWFGANAYALWANRRDWRAFRGNASPALSSRGRSHPATPPAETLFSMLPSEAQWEYAARGPEPRLFPWGNEPVPEMACIGRHTRGDCYSC